MNPKGESLTTWEAHRDGSNVTEVAHLGPGPAGLTALLASYGKRIAFSTTKGLRRRQLAHIDRASFLQPIN